MKFLCDAMLKRRGQWLRIAGHDVLMLPGGTSDRELIQRAVEEHRVLVTRDREMAALANGRVKLTTFDCIDLEDCVRAIGRQLDIDWLHAACNHRMNCNTPLVACIWLFSSQLKTTAFSGGDRYSLTRYSSFSTNCLSFHSLKVFIKCGFRPCAFQIRATEDSLTLIACAIGRLLQCVAPSAWDCAVSVMISSTVCWVICGLRPGFGASFSIPAKPYSIERRCQRFRHMISGGVH